MSTKSLSVRRHPIAKSFPQITFNGTQAIVLDGNAALCLLNPQGNEDSARRGSVFPIPLSRPLCITGKQLKEFNAESIRLGFSRNLDGIEVIPDALNIPICTVFRHVSTDAIPKKNIRLMFSLPTFIPKNWQQQIKKMAKTLVSVTLDIPPDTFAAIRKQEEPRG